MFIWYLLIYFGLYYGMILMLKMFFLSWIWLIVAYSFLIGIISFFVSSIPAIVSVLILKFYRMNWFSIITHSIAGIVGIIHFYYIMFENPPEMISGQQSTPILEALWNQSWLKTILLMFPFIGLQLGIIYQGIFSPIMVKMQDYEAEY